MAGASNQRLIIAAFDYRSAIPRSLSSCQQYYRRNTTSCTSHNNMRSIYIIILALVSACAADTYSSDKTLDVKAIIADETQMKAFIGCLSGKNDCGPAVAAARVELRDAVGDACARCTDNQKSLAKEFFAACKKNYSAEYEGLKHQ